MSYQGFTKRSALNVILVLLVSLLVACGGGGGGSKPTPTPIPTLAPTPVPDTTPEPFSFTLPAVSPEAGATVTLDALTITGLDAAAIITISGGEYAIDGGAFTALQGIIENSQSLQVQAVASSNFSGEVDVTVTIGGVIESFTLTTIAEDTTPEAFSFSAVTDAALGATVSSNTVTITGLNSPAPVSITGGDYAIGSGTATNLGGTITNGQTLTLSVTTAATFSTATTATVTVGGVTADFVVTTLAQDTTPDVFSFTDVDNVERDIEVTSNTVTIVGINDAASVSITGGTYAIDDGGYTATESSVVAGQTLTVKAQSPALASAATDVVLTVGGISDTFTINTLIDNTAPVAEMHFPTQVSLTEGTSIWVRGIATDDLSEITSVSVNGVEAASDDGFVTWLVEVPLDINTENPLSVIATDEVGNESTAEVLATITQNMETNVSFPVENLPYSYINSIEITPDHEELIVSNDAWNIWAVNSQTGAYRLFSAAPNADALDADLNHRIFDTVYVPSETGDQFYAIGQGIFVVDVDAGTGDRTVISNDDSPDTSILYGNGKELDIFVGDTEAESYLVVGTATYSVIRVDMVAGNKELISDIANAGQGVVLENITSIVVDSISEKAYLGGRADSEWALVELDLLTGNREQVAGESWPNDAELGPIYGSYLTSNGDFLYGYDGGHILRIDFRVGETYGYKTLISSGSSGDFPSADNHIAVGRNLVLWEDKGIAYVVEYRGIYVVDLETGYRVVLTRAQR
ncbi:hypothetical protein [Teredinibacter haidensis]|uniref:hypothetical protein n=1 Tax=Teredinibacter haidensis TaxID=2731755 RepID=UPI00163B6FC1|nr:hypothetical protein [Teredinibacter haidensis]